MSEDFKEYSISVYSLSAINGIVSFGMFHSAPEAAYLATFFGFLLVNISYFCIITMENLLDKPHD